MTDYIKREDAKDAVINIVGWEKIAKYVDEMSKHPSTKDIDYYDALMDAEDAIDDLPSADVAPVRHGRWIEYGENKDGTHNICCSVCDGFFKSKGHANSCYTRNKYRYCHNCGARMDGGIENE